MVHWNLANAADGTSQPWGWIGAGSPQVLRCNSIGGQLFDRARDPIAGHRAMSVIAPRRGTENFERQRRVYDGHAKCELAIVVSRELPRKEKTRKDPGNAAEAGLNREGNAMVGASDSGQLGRGSRFTARPFRAFIRLPIGKPVGRSDVDLVRLPGLLRKLSASTAR